MNYHKKIQEIGFKKHRPLIVSRYRNYKEKIEGFEIMDPTKYLSIKFIETKNININSNTTFSIPEMNMLINKEDSKKFQSYKWKISEIFNLYITIYKETFCCFGTDLNAAITKNEWIKERIFFNFI